MTARGWARALAAAGLLAGAALSAQSPGRLLTLGDGWRLQSAARVSATGDAISRPGFATAGWYATAVPTTVLAALVANKVYPDPYVGNNLRSIPGASYAIGRNFANLPMPDGSPFRSAWWFRRAFELTPAMRGKRVALHFDGINYRANVWLNGRRIGQADSVAGAFRLYELDVTRDVKPLGVNVLAVEVSAPDVLDLAMTWVDWNPAPPDKDMGLYRRVYLTASGPVALRYPQVVSTVDTARQAWADLAVSVQANNVTDRAIMGTLRGEVDGIALTAPLAIGPHDSVIVRFTAADVPALHLTRPRLWWPAGMGQQPLSDVRFTATIDGAESDRTAIRFGVRQITSEFAAGGGRLFRINGKPMLIRGGGYAADMMLRADPVRQERELRYTKAMGLNAVRLEGKPEDEHFLDLADRMGILVLAGWSCCDQWEQWRKWTPEDTVVAAASQRDQIRRLRHRASLLAWMNGSDNPPPAQIESVYVAIIKALDWPNPYVSSATGKRAATGPSGVKMNGPYDWVPPNYWMIDSTHGGAFGFNTETSPGPAVPPIESLRRTVGAAHLWPPDSMWLFHAGGGQFANITAFSNALSARFGAPTDAEDFAAKSQLMTYEGQRAMFEAFSRNRYRTSNRATGIIQWMLNDAWPSLIWHLYDWYLVPGGGYFGTKKAFEPVHAMYSYDDGSVAVVNETGKTVSRARLTIRSLALDGAVLDRVDTTLDIPADTVLRIARKAGASAAPYFLDLRITSTGGGALSTNFYWLADPLDAMDIPKSNWYITPVTKHADFTALATMPRTTVARSLTIARAGTTETARVTLTNMGKAPAVFMRLQLTRGDGGSEIVPILWDDNYVSLFPGETRTVSATYAAADRWGIRAALRVTGVNVGRK